MPQLYHTHPAYCPSSETRGPATDTTSVLDTTMDLQMYVKSKHYVHQKLIFQLDIICFYFVAKNQHPVSDEQREIA